MASSAPFTPDDRALFDRVARRVVELRMETPAILTLESLTPMSLVAGQAMVFFEPFVAALLRLPDYQRFAKLIQRREALPELCAAIERHADAAHAARRAEREARRAGSTHPPRH